MDHLRRLTEAPLLTPEMEIHLAKVVQAGLHKNATPKQKAAQQRARNRMIVSNTRLVINIAKGIHRQCQCKSITIEDLVQYGVIGLNNAVTKYDPERGYKFSTYAYWWIRQEMHRSIGNNENTIRIPIHIRDKVIQFKRKTALLDYSDNYESIQKTAKELKLTPETLQLVRTCKEISSLDYVVKNDKHGTALHELVAAPDKFSFLENYGFDNDIDLCGLLRHCLNPQELLIISHIYGLNDYEVLNLQQIGKKLGLSRERIRQKRNSIETKLVKYLEQHRCSLT